MLPVDIGPPLPCRALQKRQQAAPIDRPGDGQPGCFQQGRHHVAQLDHLVRHATNAGGLAFPVPGQASRRHDQERDAGAALVGIGLAPQVMIALHVAVVRGKQQPRVRQRLALKARHPVQQPPDLGVDERYLAVIARAGAMGLLCRHPSPPGVGINRVLGPIVHRRPVAHVRRRGLVVDVLLPVRLRRHVGRVWAGERDVEEKGPSAVPRLQKGQRPAHGPCRGMQVLVRMPGTRQPRVPVHAVVVGRDAARRALGKPGPVLVGKAVDQCASRLVQLARLETHRGPLRRKVSLAHHVGAIAGARQLAGQGVREIVRYGPLAPAHAQDAGVPLVLAGPQRGSRRQARGHGAVGVRKARAPRGERIQVRRLDHRVSIGAQAIAAHLIAHDQEDIRSIRRHSPLPR